MSEIKLQQRYPNSRYEDIIDAFLRGYTAAIESSAKLIKEHVAENENLRKQLHEQQDTAEHNFLRNAREYNRVCDENAKLRKLVSGLLYCAHEAYGMCARTPIGGGKPFTCCPLYNFEIREYCCEKLMCELGIKLEG